MDTEKAVEAPEPASASTSAPESSAMAETALTEEQTRALFDILTHCETYAEIEGFKAPDAVTSYGFPFGRTMKAAAAIQTPSTGGTPKGETPRSRTPVSFWLGGRGKNVEDKEKSSGSGGGDGNGDAKDEGDSQSEDEAPVESTSPLLQMLLTRLVLPFPGVRDLPREFWDVRMQGLLARFAEADLSESYDKGAMGTRKTLATGASSVMEMVARGLLGGVDRTGFDLKRVNGDDDGKADTQRKGGYDEGKAEDLSKAFADAWEQWAYGELVEELFDHVATTDDVEGHSPMMKAALDYAIIQ